MSSSHSVWIRIQGSVEKRFSGISRANGQWAGRSFTYALPLPITFRNIKSKDIFARHYSARAIDLMISSMLIASTGATLLGSNFNRYRNAVVNRFLAVNLPYLPILKWKVANSHDPIICIGLFNFSFLIAIRHPTIVCILRIFSYDPIDRRIVCSPLCRCARTNKENYDK